MKNSGHALVIGGTGMLSGVCLGLAEAGWDVSVVGRTADKFKPLKQAYPRRILPLIGDYNSKEFYGTIRSAVAEKGNFDLIVSWTPNYRVLEDICQMNAEAAAFQLVHVKGSRRYFKDEDIQLPQNCRQQIVYLGYKRENGQSRWLTHEEVSEGILECIKTGNKKSIIGQIHPYEARPH